MKEGEKMKGVIYARYSSDSQREESIEGQLRECRRSQRKMTFKSSKHTLTALCPQEPTAAPTSKG